MHNTIDTIKKIHHHDSNNNIADPSQDPRLQEAISYIKKKEYKKAKRLLQSFQKDYPDDINSYHFLGIIAMDIEDYQTSCDYLKKAYDLQSYNGQLAVNYGLALQKNGEEEKGNQLIIDTYNRYPHYDLAAYNAAVTMCEHKQYEESLKPLTMLLKHHPDHISGWNQKGHALRHLGYHKEANECFLKAYELNPSDYKYASNIILDTLLLGDYKRAWKYFRNNVDLWHENFPNRVLPTRPWRGELLKGRSLFVYPEQGFGDTIMFMRFLPIIAEKYQVAEMIYCCPASLERLTFDYHPIIKKSPYDMSTDMPPHDCYTHMMDLAAYSYHAPYDCQSRYLIPHPRLVASWRSILSTRINMNTIKIGLVWAGKPSYGNDKQRSVPLETLSPIIKNLADVTWVSLQMGDGKEALKNSDLKNTLIDVTDDITDFADTAAIIQNLDLVISVDTSVVHLTGAMGFPCWALIPYPPDWRWLLKREDSIWYDSVRLFRQNIPWDWHEPLKKLYNCLAQFCKK